MNDDRLVGMLAAMRTERLDRHADQEIRQRLETAWTARAPQSGFALRFRRPVLVIATAALILSSANLTLTAAGDSPLYSVRVTIENAALRFYTDPEDRAAYLLALLEQRTAEAARLEATGNALAAGAARDVERATLAMVLANQPPAPENVQPAPTESPSPSPSPTPTPSPSPTPSPTPVPTAPPPVRTLTPTIRPTPTPTAKPPTATPKPTAAPTAQLVTFTGTIKNPDGSPATNVCVSNSPGGMCLQVTTGSSFSVSFSVKIGQSVTLYFLRSDGTKTYKQTITKTASSTYVQVGTVTLKVQ